MLLVAITLTNNLATTYWEENLMRIPLFGRGKMDAAVDPVCSMDVNVKTPPGGTHQHGDQTYYFCGPGCRVAFSKEPEAYLSGEKKINM